MGLQTAPTGRTHARTHTRLFLWIVGTFHRRNGFYTVQTVFSIALHLNLPLTGNWKFHSVWFISVLKYGDMGKCPHKSPSPCNTCHTHVIIQICVLMSQKHAHSTHTPATQPELFSARLELLLLYDYRLQHNALIGKWEFPVTVIRLSRLFHDSNTEALMPSAGDKRRCTCDRFSGSQLLWK